jgi:hypothetical protein
MNGHQVALWAGVSAFFASLLAIGALDLSHELVRGRDEREPMNWYQD